jgi:hypothetical protein
MDFPYYSPQVLTDQIFVDYGGMTGTSTSAQRQAAFLMAEKQMTEHLFAFLVPTIITGSVFYRGGTLFETEFGRVNSVLDVQFTRINSLSPLETQISTGSALVRNAKEGLLDIFIHPDYYASTYYGMVYDRKVVYESGFSTGTVTQPDMLAALTMAAQINLNEMDISLSNEGTADIGVQVFTNQSYREERTKLLRTPFGSSAMAQRVANLTKGYRCKPSFGFY